jgi:hypothetical protein
MNIRQLVMPEQSAEKNGDEKWELVQGYEDRRAQQSAMEGGNRNEATCGTIHSFSKSERAEKIHTKPE